jgi:methylmalonyl-CoA mutase N-terminal domain/subunit
VDPLGGSDYIESLTNEIEMRAMEYIERIEGLGGVVSCIESGWIQNEIQNSSYQFQLDLEAKREIVVGVNDFTQEESGRTDVLKVSERTAAEQIERLKKYKGQRDSKKAAAALEKVRVAAQGDQNLMPVFVNAVENSVTLGEIAEELRKVFGLFKESITL